MNPAIFSWYTARISARDLSYVICDRVPAFVFKTLVRTIEVVFKNATRGFRSCALSVSRVSRWTVRNTNRIRGGKASVEVTYLTRYTLLPRRIRNWRTAHFTPIEAFIWRTESIRFSTAETNIADTPMTITSLFDCPVLAFMVTELPSEVLNAPDALRLSEITHACFAIAIYVEIPKTSVAQRRSPVTTTDVAIRPYKVADALFAFISRPRHICTWYDITVGGVARSAYIRCISGAGKAGVVARGIAVISSPAFRAFALVIDHRTIHTGLVTDR